MRRFPFVKRISLAIAATTAAITPFAMAGDILTDSRYESLRTEFLNIDPNYYTELNIAGIPQNELTTWLDPLNKSSPFTIPEQSAGVHDVWYRFGAPHVCTNSQGQQSACWYATGGSLGQRGEDYKCGESVNSDYAYALANPAAVCGNNQGWAGYKFWLGSLTNVDYLKQQFPKGKDMPANRVCVEVEFPDASKLTMGYSGKSDVEGDSEFRQLVNPNVAGDHLKNIMWEWGTYTATKKTADGLTSDEEVGSVYQTGGSHFYHKPTDVGIYPLDKIYAIDRNTLAICMGNIPSSVRSGMRPAYAANPLLTIGGTDAEGVTTAPGYIDYITRLYLQANMDAASTANYPFDIKLNKVWLMYENNEIFAMNRTGATLGLDMIENGETAYYPFTVYNTANEDRTYRVALTTKSTGLLKDEHKELKLYIDSNSNGILDSDESNQTIKPQDKITLAAGKNMSLILAHTPNFGSTWLAKEAYGRQYAQASFSIVEIDRLRSASYAVRTWEGTQEEQKTKQEWFEKTQYPSAESEWSIYHDYNLGKNLDTNPDLIRNTPDYKAISRLRRKPLPPNWK